MVLIRIFLLIGSSHLFCFFFSPLCTLTMIWQEYFKRLHYYVSCMEFHFGRMNIKETGPTTTHYTRRVCVFLFVYKKWNFKWIGRECINKTVDRFNFMKKSNCMPIKIYINILLLCCWIETKARPKAKCYFLKIENSFFLRNSIPYCVRERRKQKKRDLSLLLFILLFVFIFRSSWIKMWILSVFFSYDELKLFFVGGILSEYLMPRIKRYT